MKKYLSIFVLVSAMFALSSCGQELKTRCITVNPNNEVEMNKKLAKYDGWEVVPNAVAQPTGKPAKQTLMCFDTPQPKGLLGLGNFMGIW